MLRIFSIRMNKPSEQYSIDIVGEDRIKLIMSQFSNDYVQILSNMRLMGDAMVLLNPLKKLTTPI